MCYLKKRSTALLIAAAVIILGTLFGVHRSLNSASAKIEAMFYNGVFLSDGNYTQPSIQSQLDKRATAALGLVTLANHYGDLSGLGDSLRQARLSLIEAKSIPEKFLANEKLQTAYIKLYAALNQKALTDSEKAAALKYAETLNGAGAVIQNSAYNSAVGDFIHGDLGKFPANILKKLAFVRNPEYFGMEG